jgi:Fe-S-cluster containining protein
LNAARVRPLAVRPGARFACAGDGLCCTDVHLLGPVAREERGPIERVKSASIVRGRSLAVLAPRANGHCTFLDDDLRCTIHALGIKPRSCSRYPFLLAATPSGGRIGTDHRCPCRTMGERPQLTVEAALPSLLDRSGRLSADRRIEGRIAIAARRSASFARYEAIEHALFDALSANGVAALGEPARLERWRELVIALDRIATAPTRWGAMYAAFARGLTSVASGASIDRFARPWAESFAHAERRSSPIDPEAMLADWATDAIWSLEWTHTMTLERAKAELALRARIARSLAGAISTRRDAAMAEAIAIVEVAGLSDEWSDAVR